MSHRGWAMLCATLAAIAYLPARHVLPSADLDASWGAVLHEAARRHWQYGPDIAFTYGPLGYLSVPVFAPDVFWWGLVLRVAIGAVCGWALHEVARLAGWRAGYAPAAVLVLLPPAMASTDLPWILPAMLWPVVAAGRDTRARVATGLLGVVVGLAGLVKFTTFVLAIGVAAAITPVDLHRRRWPVAAIALAGSVLGGWWLAGQSLTNLPAWIAVSWDTSAGYNEAMSTPVGPYQLRELAVFVVAAVAVMAGALTWRKCDHADVGVLLPSLALVVFVLFKLGFVRHDAHATSAFFAMPLLAAIAVAPAWRRGASRAARSAALAVLLTGLAAHAYGLRRHFDRLAPPEHYRAALVLQARAVGDLLRPVAFHARLTRARDDALAHLRATTPLGDVHGTVDAYGHHQGDLLAHPVDYTPRPVFQSYGAYTPGLAQLNRAHLAGPDGPRHVLVDPESIDFRYPLHDDGASLPVLLAAFDAMDTHGRFLHLARRATAGSVDLERLGRVRARAFDEFAVPASPSPVWGRIAIERTWVGRLATLAFKLPPIVVDVRTADGRLREHRLVRALAADGMLVSPLVETTADFMALMRQAPADDGRRVVALRVRPAWPAAYEPEIAVEWSVLQVDRRAAGTGTRQP